MAAPETASYGCSGLERVIPSVNFEGRERLELAERGR